MHPTPRPRSWCSPSRASTVAISTGSWPRPHRRQRG